MGFIYKIEVGEELYVGSTKQKYLCRRQGQHNKILNNSKYKDYNIYLYRFCREHNIEKIICELIEEVDNTELVLLEQEYITMLEPSLNTRRAYRTKEEHLEQMRLINKIKSKCPICNKLMLKNYINRHITNNHK